MREKIQKLADGIFEYESPEMAVSTTSIKEVVEECAYFSGSFFVESLSGAEIEGTVIPSHVRMWCKEPHFKGKRCEITYEADLRGLSYGEEVKGSFTLLTNGGEATIPCTISIEKCYLNGPNGQIKNLFHFANFAREDWDGAVKFFGSDNFEHLLVNNDRQYRELYRGLRRGENLSQAMDEFLVAVHKKERAQIALPEKKKNFKHVEERERFSITLEKNTWGYVSARITVKGGFLEIEKELVTQEDFLGNTCEIFCFVNPGKLHGGMNTGSIQVETDFETFTCQVEVDMRQNLHIWDIEERLLKGRLALSRAYLDFREKKLTVLQFSEKGLSLLEELERLDSENPFFELLHVQLLLIAGKEQDAVWYFNAFEDGKELKGKDESLYGYFLYLQACLKKGLKESKKTQEIIADLYEKQKSFLLLWVRLYMDEELRERNEEKWQLLSKQYERGCRSPLLYLEAWELLCSHDNLLKAMDPFTVQVFFFAVKENLLTESFSERILSLSLRGTGFSQVLFKIYTAIYEKFPTKEHLAAVIGLMIRGQKTGGDYTAWYLLGVQQNLKIAGLFENYMESIDWGEKKDLPQNLLLYYAMDNSLSDRKKAWIYGQLVRRKGEIPGAYKQHKKEMEEFRNLQLEKGAIDENLAILYREYLQEQQGLPREKRDEALAAMEPLLFTCQIVCNRKDIGKVLVVHQYLNRVEEYPCREEEVFAPVYTEEDTIILIGKDGRCYGREEDYRLIPLFEKERFFPMFDEASLGMQIRMELAGQRYRNITPDNENQVLALLGEKDLQTEIRQEILERLLVFYKNSGMHRELEQLLTKLRLEKFSDIARSRILEFMLAEGMYEQAWPVIQEYGFSEIYAGKLVGILGFRIRETAFEWDAPLLKMCGQVFEKGKYNEDMLEYLMRHAQTGSKKMLQIWQAAFGFGEDTLQLGERLLEQSLFTGIDLAGLEEVAEKLAGNGGNPVLIKAYLTRESYNSLVEEKVLSAAIFSQIEKLLKSRTDVPVICRAAWLKGIAEGKSGNIDRKLLFDCVKVCKQEGFVFPFFKELEKRSGESLGLEQLEVILHKAAPDSRVVLHSMLMTGKEQENAYLLEPMKQILPGIYMKQLTLFSGERMVYYITEENHGEPGFFEQQELVGRAPEFVSGSRKNLLGQIAGACDGEEADEAVLLARLDEYISLDYMTEQLFRKK